MKAKLLYLLTFSFLSGISLAQSQINYNDFEGNSFHFFGAHSGILDSAHANPMSNGINQSAKCAQYKRDSLAFDFLTIMPMGYLTQVKDYCTHDSLVKQFRFKLYSTAPIGTFIELQIGSKKDSSFPSGIHSQYQAITKKRNEWEEITFEFSQIPTGSLVSSGEIDKIAILFYPYSLSRDTFYFDDFMGPELTQDAVSVVNIDIREEKISISSYPNPAKNNSTISYSLKKQANATIKIYNSLGKEVMLVQNKLLPAGKHQVNINLSEFPDGVYFCALDDGESIVIEKIVVVK